MLLSAVMLIIQYKKGLSVAFKKNFFNLLLFAIWIYVESKELV